VTERDPRRPPGSARARLWSALGRPDEPRPGPSGAYGRPPDLPPPAPAGPPPPTPPTEAPPLANGVPAHDAPPPPLPPDERPAPSGDTEGSASLLRGYVDLLRAHWKLIAGVTILVGVLALAYSLTRPKEYEAQVSVLFRQTSISEQVAGVPVFESPQSQSQAGAEMTTNVTLLQQAEVADAVRTRLHLDMSRKDLQAKVSVAQVGLSNVATVTVRDQSPQKAQRIANAWGDAFITLRRAADRGKIGLGLDLLRQRLHALERANPGSQLVRRAQGEQDKLQLLQAVQDGNAEVTQRAELPTDPVAPKPLRSAIIGLALGLVLGLILVGVRRALDRRVRSIEHVREIVGRPVLGAVPSSGRLQTFHAGSLDLRLRELEVFNLIRANLRYFDLDGSRRSILVTSAEAGDGKSTVSWYLSCAAALAGSRVLLIEADLRHPSFHGVDSLRSRNGLSMVLSGMNDLRDAVRTVTISSGSGEDKVLDVVSSGPVPPNPVDLMDSVRMREIITDAEQNYDLVVIDTPPTNVVSDAIPLLRQVGGVVVVTRIDKTHRASVGRLVEQMQNLRAPVLGVVVNDLKDDARAYGYGYGYGYGYYDDAATNHAVTANGDLSRAPEPAGETAPPESQLRR
jgi:succinoglycan biosynthesis transport protein ExoP